MEGDPSRLSCSLASLEQAWERNDPAGGHRSEAADAWLSRWCCQTILGKSLVLSLPILNATHLPGLFEGLNDGQWIICLAHHGPINADRVAYTAKLYVFPGLDA